MPSSNEIIKTITERVVRYIDTPGEERKRRPHRRAAAREPWANRWFGQLPFAAAMWWANVRRRFRR